MYFDKVERKSLKTIKDSQLKIKTMYSINKKKSGDHNINIKV